MWNTELEDIATSAFEIEICDFYVPHIIQFVFPTKGLCSLSEETIATPKRV